MRGSAIRYGAGLLALAALSGAAWAQGFPSKSIRMVVPYGTGGNPDVLARLVAQKMADSIRQQVVVDNRPGAGGIIASQLVAKSEADGYTMMVTVDADYAFTPAIRPELPYDPARDFTAVTQGVNGTYFLVTNPSLGVGNVTELIALARTRPGKIFYGSPGSGQGHHLAMETLKHMAKIDLTHIPYKGAAQATPALLAGDISVMFMGLPTVAPHVKANRLRILAVGAPQRNKAMPEVPTISESGLPGFGIEFAMGFVVPGATPRPIIDRLNAETVKALKQPDVESKLFEVGMEVVAGTPEQFNERIRRDREHWKKLMPQLGLKIE